MRPEWRWGIAAVLALAAGAFCAEPYARLAAPYYAAVDRLVASQHPWAIEEVAVTVDPSGRGSVLRLIGEVRRNREDLRPAALVVNRLQLGEVIEVPLVFWTLLLVWPGATGRERWARLAVGVVVFLSLEAFTTAAELICPMAATAALLTAAPLTLWERWSRFLEAGGTFVLAAATALVTLAVANAIARRRPVEIREGGAPG